ncbi:MAG TPA: four helix bundle protein [Patescibacteria group bacterium]
MKINKFEELEIWKSSLGITRDIYDFTAKKEFSRDFGLRDQIRRAIVSASSNIVEGFEKNNNNEFIRFLKIAKGSVGEVRNQLYIALSVKYISEEEFEKTNKELESLARQIGAFIIYLQNKRLDNQFSKK